MIPLFPKDDIYPVCRKACLDTFGEHADLHFLIDPQEGRSTLRQAHIMLYGWVGEKYVWVDLTGVSPLVEQGLENFIVGWAFLKAASNLKLKLLSQVVFNL
jgi:hypothetical protein